MYLLRLVAAATLVAAALGYDNDAPNSLLPPLGWSSWVALGPAADHAIFDFCDEFSVKAAADAFVEVVWGLGFSVRSSAASPLA